MEQPKKKSLTTRMRTSIRGYMIRGLMILVPLGITAYVLNLIYRLTAASLVPMVKSSALPLPEYAVIALSAVLFFCFLYLIGLVATAVVGRKFIELMEALINKIPIVTTIYSASKQVVELLSRQDAEGNYQASVYVDFPAPNIKALAFLTNRIHLEGDKEYSCVFVPTTPNPTSGYMEFCPPEHVYKTNLSVEEALKAVMSAGILAPETVEIRPMSASPAQKRLPDAGDSPQDDPEPVRKQKTLWQRLKQIIRARLVSGFIVVVPLGITFVVIQFIYDLTIGKITPYTERFMGHLPTIAVTGISVALFFAALYGLGLVTTAVVGKRLMALAEWIITRIPLVTTIYGASKQIVEAISFQSDGPNLKASVLVDFPYPDLKAIGFSVGNFVAKDGEEYVKIFLPTTPNITVGLYLTYPPGDVKYLDLSIEDAIQIIVSGGLLAPSTLSFVEPH